jgi:hypothetical protein
VSVPASLPALPRPAGYRLSWQAGAGAHAARFASLGAALRARALLPAHARRVELCRAR